MYSQRDGRWAEKCLGSSGKTMDHIGCVVTNVANALIMAGFETDPGQVLDKLNANGGFLDDGRLIWAKVEEAYPQFHFGGEGYDFKKGLLGKVVHWVLEHNAKIVDPYTGIESMPDGFKETEGSRTAGIDSPAVSPAPETSPDAPKLIEKVYTVVEGDSLSKIAKKELGDGNRWPEIYELNKDQIENSDLIYPDQVLKMPN